MLICHPDEPLNFRGLSRWLASWSELRAIIVVDEPRSRVKARVKREIKRVGLLRFADVLAFRLYYKLFLAKGDTAREQELLAALEQRYPALPASTRIIHVSSPNAPEVRELLQQERPTFMIARCKSILRPEIFQAPREGTFVLHPGVCPEYRNAHGCFWALARRDMDRVGVTLLRVDAGVDTGAVFGYFTYPFDEKHESHITIQDRVVLDNLETIRGALMRVLEHRATRIDTTGRESRAWGQPWLSAYLRWKRAARRDVKRSAA